MRRSILPDQHLPTALSAGGALDAAYRNGRLSGSENG